MKDKDKALEYLRGLEKLKASKIKSEDYTSPLEQDVMKVKGPSTEWDNDFTKKFPGATEHIKTGTSVPLISGSDFKSKIDALRAAKAGGKKLLGALPFAGAGIAALQGDPAMAAEELAMDLPGAEALRSEAAGQSPEEEAQMLAEIDAQKAYNQSPARLAKLKALLGKK